ncbi:MFS transporter [Streptomyces sp. SID4919]|uniref:MFS transporter n=1 Tax=unclassified Streptomyces TaxID=2593676 RepID=UPI000823E19C|nr:MULTISPECIES: MFS transporter [unclassified Streptomyces]MYY09185.1 MFS transporter [Streptomyces sp. SID4919]SCK29652.1 Predicted arabinose efflux permease, MFS family [Streptomyces sp. AmelKG-E11A]
MASYAPVHGTGSDPDRTTARQWLAVAVLCFSTFVVVTSEMLPVGVLTPMADGLRISPGSAGFSLSVTGLTTAVTAPLVPRLLGGLDRRTVLAAAMVVLAAGNALTAVAEGFGPLVVSRIVLGIGMGVVWGLAAAVATRLVAARNAALAVSVAVSGVAAASVAGVPLGTVISNAFGWRAAFAVLATAALLLAAGLLLTLPRLPRPPAPTGTDGRAERGSLLRNTQVAVGLVLIVFLVTAHFAAYTYVRPVLEERTGLTDGSVALVLAVYGVFGLIGNFAAGALAGRRARPTLLGLTAGIGAAVALLALFGTVTGITAMAVALWGLAYGGVSVACQIWMAQAAPDRVEQVTGLYVGVFTAAIALGAFLGGTIVEAAGITALLWSAVALTGVAFAVGLARPGPADRGGDPAGRGGDPAGRSEDPSGRAAV